MTNRVSAFVSAFMSERVCVCVCVCACAWVNKRVNAYACICVGSREQDHVRLRNGDKDVVFKRVIVLFTYC